MKKRKILLPAIAAVAMMTMGYHGFQSFSTENDTNNPMLLQNIEALTKAPEVQRPCDNSNGYRQWSKSGFLRSKKEFYDCCYIKQSGYNPSDNCQ